MEEYMRVRTVLNLVLGLIILFAFNHKSAQRSFASAVYCIAEPSGTSFEGLWMGSCGEGHCGVTEWRRVSYSHLEFKFTIEHL